MFNPLLEGLYNKQCSKSLFTLSFFYSVDISIIFLGECNFLIARSINVLSSFLFFRNDIYKPITILFIDISFLCDCIIQDYVIVDSHIGMLKHILNYLPCISFVANCTLFLCLYHIPLYQLSHLY